MSKAIHAIYILISFIICAFGQRAWISGLCYLAATIGFALFWRGARIFSSSKKRFFAYVCWFFLVSLVQLSWFSSTKYQGKLILIVYFGVAIFLGLEFGLLSFLIKKQKSSLFRILYISSIWTLLEWSRLFILSGLPFNPLGLSLANNEYSIGFASIGGIYLLSFWVILLNLCFYELLKEGGVKIFARFLLFLFIPYFFGYTNIKYHEEDLAKADKHNVILVQTALLPEEKVFLEGHADKFIHPILQWGQIFKLINKTKAEGVDLIVLPETAVSYGAFYGIYPLEAVYQMWSKHFGKDAIRFLPSIASEYVIKNDVGNFVGNAFFAKGLANYFGADVVAGFDHVDEQKSCYNSAFFFSKKNEGCERYDKRILAPIAEYFPFDWCRSLAYKYGIEDPFQKGVNFKIFAGKEVCGISICYEEVYGNFIRRSINDEAMFLVNITNDGWFFNSKLFLQHYYLAVLRAVENGMGLVRCCNTAVTAGIDAFGREIAKIDNEKEKRALLIKLPLYRYKTLYRIWGDFLVIGAALVLIILRGIYYFKREI